MASQDWLQKDFYATLGVPSDVDEATLKKTYRKLARQYHPDNHPGDDAAEQKFKEIGEAYSVLSDKEQRQQYDAIRQMAAGGPRFSTGGAGGAGFEDIFGQMFGGGAPRGGRAGGVNFEDLFGGMAGGGMGGYPGGGMGGGMGGFGHQAPQKGRDVEARTTLTFRQAAEGDTITLTSETRKVTARIPAGIKDGQRIRLRGKGDPGPGGLPAGDMILTVRVSPHSVFGRDGNNLTVDLPVTFAEAALGATVQVPTLSGDTVKVKVAPGTPNGRVLRIKGRGIEAKNGTGDLLAKVTIQVPTTLSDKAAEAVRTLQEETSDADPRAELFTKARD